MSNTETMPELRAYLREREFEKVPEVNCMISKPLELAVFFGDIVRFYRRREVADRVRYRLLDSRVGQPAAIDWLEKNYPKEEK